MTSRKERLTVTVDPDLIEAGNQAVAAGLAESLSGWVNAALVEQATRDRRLQSLSDAISAYRGRPWADHAPMRWPPRPAVIVRKPW